MDELVRLEIPAVPAYVGVARTVVATVATSVDGIDDDRLEHLRIAVSEACTNAVEAHLTGATDQRVVLRCLVDVDWLEVHVEDRGPGFDPGAVPPRPPVDDPVHLRSERGWGTQLIEALVDQAEFSRHDDVTAVRLGMRLEHNGSDS